MNIYDAMDLLNEGKKVYNKYWSGDSQVRYIWIKMGSEQDLVLDDNGNEFPASGLLYTEGWEEFVLLTAEEKAILKALINISNINVLGVVFKTFDYSNNAPEYSIVLRNDNPHDTKIYTINNKKLFKKLVPNKIYNLRDLALDEEE